MPKDNNSVLAKLYAKEQQISQQYAAKKKEDTPAMAAYKQHKQFVSGKGDRVAKFAKAQQNAFRKYIDITLKAYGWKVAWGNEVNKTYFNKSQPGKQLIIQAGYFSIHAGGTHEYTGTTVVGSTPLEKLTQVLRELNSGK